MFANLAIFGPFKGMIYLSYFQTTSLKSCCEYALKLHIDDETALYLISLADQLNAKVLKVCCIYEGVSKSSCTNAISF